MNNDELHPIPQHEGEYKATKQTLGDYSNQQLGVYPLQDFRECQVKPKPE